MGDFFWVLWRLIGVLFPSMSMISLRRLIPNAAVAVFGLFSAGWSPAQFDGFSFSGGSPRAADAQPLSISLIAPVEAAVPGSRITLAFKFAHQPKWHSYWVNPGGFTLPTEIVWELPEGMAEPVVRWPVPERIESQGFPAYIFGDIALIPVDVEIPADAAPGSSITLKANVSGQVCKEACVLFDQSPSIILEIAGNERPHAENAASIAEAVARLPREVPQWLVTASQGAAGPVLNLVPGEGAAEIGKAYFFSYIPDVDGQIDQPLVRTDDGWTLGLPMAESQPDGAEAGRFRGILWTPDGWVAGDDRSQAMAVDVVIGAGSGGKGVGLDLGMIGLALLGGLILNLMPCVFPVLGLKVMNFVNQAGEDHRKVVLHGLVFTLGVLISFWILAGLIIVLKQVGGESLRWGFQLQEAGFVFALAFVLFVFSLSLAGLFEFGIGATSVGGSLQRKSGFTGSFFSGVLATVVATPCAAPFLAPALGVALALPPFPSLVLFTCIALGLSLPYLVLSAFPQLINMLPKPGAWMETFKHIMSFPLFATVAWLLWVLSKQVDHDKYLAILFGFVVTALALFIYGRWGLPWLKPTVKHGARAAAVVLILASVAWSWPREEVTVDWQPWSVAEVSRLRAEGRPVFIDFTAAWCPTCKANKMRYNKNTEVIELMKQKGVVALQADFTNKDKEIGRALVGYGKGAIPVNVIYRPGADSPEFLPELFGSAELIERFSSLPDRK